MHPKLKAPLPFSHHLGAPACPVRPPEGGEKQEAMSREQGAGCQGPGEHCNQWMTGDQRMSDVTSPYSGGEYCERLKAVLWYSSLFGEWNRNPHLETWAKRNNIPLILIIRLLVFAHVFVDLYSLLSKNINFDTNTYMHKQFNSM